MVSRKFITDFSLFLMVKSHRQICQALPPYCADSTACHQTFARCSTSRQNLLLTVCHHGWFFFSFFHDLSIPPSDTSFLCLLLEGWEVVVVVGGGVGRRGWDWGMGALATRIPYPKKQLKQQQHYSTFSLLLSLFLFLSFCTHAHAHHASANKWAC